jgi:hypothetical protein
MCKQHTFASVAYTSTGKVTRRERFLAEMDAVIPWTEQESHICSDPFEFSLSR